MTFPIIEEGTSLEGSANKKDAEAHQGNGEPSWKPLIALAEEP
jgi:hypothetical protein